MLARDGRRYGEIGQSKSEGVVGFFFSRRSRHTRSKRDWSSDVCSSDLPSSEWTVAGKPLPKVDGRAFVTGKHPYTPDLRPAGLYYAKILRPPSFGATLVSCDAGAAKAMPNVAVVRDGNF